MGNKPSRKVPQRSCNQMVEDAIAALKKRPWSSQSDIFQYLEGKYEKKISPKNKKTLRSVIRSVAKTKTKPGSVKLAGQKPGPFKLRVQKLGPFKVGGQKRKPILGRAGRRTGMGPSKLEFRRPGRRSMNSLGTLSMKSRRGKRNTTPWCR